MSDDQKRQRAENRVKPAEEIIPNLPTEARPYVYRVGVWLWAEFPSKPSAETRQRLVELGFSWNSTRYLWQHTGGVFRHASKTDPRTFYGMEKLKEETVPA